MKKCLSVLLAVLLLAAAIPLGAVNVSAATSGTTGNCTWVLNGTALTISGNGSMADYSYECGPWGSDITSLTIKSGVTYVGDFAFYQCYSLQSISIPYGVTSIGDYAFCDCASLCSLTIPNSVKYIGEATFNGCCELTSLTIPDSVTSIGDAAFSGGYRALKTISIGSGLTYMPSGALYGHSKLESITVSSQNTKFSSSNGALFDKSQTTLIKFPAKKTGAYTIPSTVTSIESRAFYDGCSLTSITIPAGLTNLSNIDFGSSLKEIDVNSQNNKYCSVDGVLFNKAQTTLVKYPPKKTGTSYAIPSTVTAIESSAFSDCSSLSTVTIPDGVTSIGRYAFYGCSSLTDVHYGGTEADRANMTIDSYGNDPLLNATWHCALPKGLLYEIADGEVTITGYTDELPTDLTIPATVDGYPVTSIGSNAFLECPFNSVTLPDSITTIGGAAFSYSGIGSIVIPVGVTDIADDAFHALNCTFEVAADNPNYSALDGILFNKDQTTIVACGMLYADAYAIPDSVTTIGSYAFFGADIDSLTIPVGVTSIESNAFATAKITDVYYGGTVEDRDNMTIDSSNYKLLNATWHCHEHTYDDNCDVDCNDCGDLRVAPHTYDNACDAACNGCGADRTPADHVYDHDFDVDCNVCGAVRAMEDAPMDFGGNSVSDDVSGLAFKFGVDVLGMTVDRTTAIYDGATIHGYKLVAMGAIVSNGISTVDVPCVYLCDWAEDAIAYAVRVIEIPTDKYDVPITSTPYFVIEVDGVQRTVYGETRTASYNLFA